MSDILFGSIEKMNQGMSWGRFLDAGTGVHSLKWIQTLSTDSYTAITADEGMRQTILNESSVKSLRVCDSLIVGNWMDEDGLCSTIGQFDTILADYLIGAVDGFSPFEQDRIVDRLKGCLKPNGRLYIIGMNPIPDYAPAPANIIVEVRRVRDACILLAGHRPYREFPLEWMIRHLNKSKFKVNKTKSFSILHSSDSIHRQIKVAQSKLQLVANVGLRNSMQQYLNELSDMTRASCLSTQTGRIPLSFDYVISAQHDDDNSSNNEINSTTLLPPAPPAHAEGIV